MDFMLDLETFGVDVKAPVFSIGCVPVQQPMDEGFYSLVMPEGVPGMDTVAWWLKQAKTNPEAADQAIKAIEEGVDYTTGILDLFDYMRRTWAMASDDSGVGATSRSAMRVWSKGSIFDIAILRRAAEHRGLDIPWTYRNEMCFRTVELVFGVGVDDPPSTVGHHAREDARWQAQKLNNIINAHKDSAHLIFNGE